MTAQFTTKQHDTLPIHNIGLLQTDPANPAASIPVDLTNAASAKLIAKIQGASPAVSFTSVLAFATPRTNGVVVYTPVAGDTAVAGVYVAEVEVTWSSPTGIETYPNDTYFTISVVADLG